MHISNEGAGEGRTASAGDRQQPRPRCRGAVPGDGTLQGKGGTLRRNRTTELFKTKFYSV